MATYYIAPPPTGSDSTGNGSIGSPWATFAKGIGSLASGDTLYVRGGTYAERWGDVTTPIASGTSWAAPTTVSAYPGETPIMAVTSTGNSYIGFSTGNTHYVVFSGLTLDGINLSSNSELMYVGAGDHIRIQNMEIKNGNNIGIFVPAAMGAGVEFLNNNIHNCGRDGQGMCIYLEAGGVLVSGNLLHDNTGGGMQADDSHTGARSDNNTIIGNRVYNNTATSPNIAFGMAFDGNNNLIANNVIYANKSEGLLVGFGGGTAGSGTQVYNNTIITSNGNDNGIYIGPFSTPDSVLVKNNICRTYNNGNGVIVNNGTNTVLSNNLTNSDPLFVNFAGNDFHLQAGSPAIDAGTTV